MGMQSYGDMPMVNTTYQKGYGPNGPIQPSQGPRLFQGGFGQGWGIGGAPPGQGGFPGQPGYTGESFAPQQPRWQDLASGRNQLAPNGKYWGYGGSDKDENGNLIEQPSKKLLGLSPEEQEGLRTGVDPRTGQPFEQPSYPPGRDPNMPGTWGPGGFQNRGWGQFNQGGPPPFAPPQPGQSPLPPHQQFPLPQGFDPKAIRQPGWGNGVGQQPQQPQQQPNWGQMGFNQRQQNKIANAQAAGGANWQDNLGRGMQRKMNKLQQGGAMGQAPQQPQPQKYYL